MAKRTSPPDLLLAKEPVVTKLRKALGVTRWHAYGLIKPADYPDAIPAGIFDTRSDLAERIARFAGMPVEELRTYYAKVKEAA